MNILRNKFLVNALLALAAVIFFLAALEMTIRLGYGKHLKYEVDHEMYWKLKPDQRGFAEMFGPQASVNSQGLRGAEILPSNCTLLVLGDSFAFGSGVKDDETFSSLIGASLGGGARVINAGTPGWGLFQENIQFKRLYSLYDPDATILLLIEHDLLRVQFQEERKKEAYLAHMRLRKEFFGNIESLKFLSWGFKKAFHVRIGSSNKNQLEEYGDLKNLWSVQKQYLEEIAKISDAEGKKTILLLYPDVRQAGNNTQFYGVVASGLDPSIILINDLEPIFAPYSMSDLEVSGSDHHPSAFAHRLIAQRILEELRLLNLSASGACVGKIPG